MLIFFLTTTFFLLDFFLKRFITARFTFDTVYPLIGDILSLRLVHNTGVAFGLFQGRTTLVIIAGVLFIIMFFFFILRQKHTTFGRVCLSMILGGALCNLYDRLFLGYVVDYLDLGWWPVFNLSDSFISVGCTLLLLSYIRTGK
ncbi:signal peptidase II [Candidatus Omnitrophota bacterium]